MIFIIEKNIKANDNDKIYKYDIIRKRNYSWNRVYVCPRLEDIFLLCMESFIIFIFLLSPLIKSFSKK